MGGKVEHRDFEFSVWVLGFGCGRLSVLRLLTVFLHSWHTSSDIGSPRYDGFLGAPDYERPSKRLSPLMPVPGSRLGVPGGLAGAGLARRARAVESPLQISGTGL